MQKQVVFIIGIGSHICAHQEIKPAILSPQSRILLVRLSDYRLPSFLAFFRLFIF